MNECTICNVEIRFTEDRELKELLLEMLIDQAHRLEKEAHPV